MILNLLYILIRTVIMYALNPFMQQKLATSTPIRKPWNIQSPKTVNSHMHSKDISLPKRSPASFSHNIIARRQSIISLYNVLRSWGSTGSSSRQKPSCTKLITWTWESIHRSQRLRGVFSIVVVIEFHRELIQISHHQMDGKKPLVKDCCTGI